MILFNCLDVPAKIAIGKVLQVDDRLGLPVDVHWWGNLEDDVLKSNHPIWLSGGRTGEYYCGDRRRDDAKDEPFLNPLYRCEIQTTFRLEDDGKIPLALLIRYAPHVLPPEQCEQAAESMHA